MIVFWLIMCILVGYIASERKRNGMGFFLLSLFLSPVVGILVLILTPGEK